MPDRLLSLVVLAGCWVPPAAAGWAARRRGVASPIKSLTLFVIAWSALWFFWNLYAMPPYIPGAVPEDPLYRPPQAIAWLGAMTAGLIAPVSALAWILAYRAHKPG